MASEERTAERIPPQAVDVERAVLGAMLIEREAVPKSIEVLEEDYFYLDAHRKIFSAIMALFDRSEPADSQTIVEELRKRKELEAIGGASYLAELATEVATAANVEYHAKIVSEKALLRKMITLSTQIATECYEASQGVDDLIDQAEQRIFNLSSKRLSKGFEPLSAVLHDTFESIELSHQREGMVSGVSTGYDELDELTSGLQPSDLVIVAGRPSMGKCVSFDTEIPDPATGEMVTAQELYHRHRANLLTLRSDLKLASTHPSAFIDDGIKPVFRVRTATGREIETTASHPFLTISESDGTATWMPLKYLRVGDRIGVPRVLPCFGKLRIPEERIKVLAYLITDGNLTDTNPRFTNSNVRVMEDFVSSVEKFGGVKGVFERDHNRVPTLRVTSIERSPEEIQAFAGRLETEIGRSKWTQRRLAIASGLSPSSVYHYVNGRALPTEETFEKLCSVLKADREAWGELPRRRNEITEWLKELGVMGKSALEKTIPSFVFRLSKDLLALFINRLFACDGSAYINQTGSYGISFSSSSRKLIRQLQHLLLRFGVISKVREKRIKYAGECRTAYELSFHNAENVIRFARGIGIFGKEEVLDQIVRSAKQKKKAYTYDTVPKAFWKRVISEKERADIFWKTVGKRRGLTRAKDATPKTYKNIRRETLKMYGETLDSREIIRMAGSDLFWDRVTSIEYVGEKQVYDLTVPGTHNFVANDFIVHNTAFALCVARNAAVEHKVPVGIFSLEMANHQLAQRLLCSEARVDAHRLRIGRLPDEDWAQLSRSVGRLAEAPIFIDDSPSLSAMEIRAKARRLQSEHGIGMVIVDYLQLMRGSGRVENRQQEISQISRALKALAKELNVPVIAVSQLSRAVETRGGDRRPMLSDLRESGAIEQDADVVMFIYREERYNPDTEQKGIAEVIIGKQRNGPIGTVKLTWINEYARFENPVFRREEPF